MTLSTDFLICDADIYLLENLDVKPIPTKNHWLMNYPAAN